jgi:hypothetical protein
MHLFSFDFRDPVLSVGAWKLSVQAITLENVYGLDPDTLERHVHDASETWHAARLRFAGQQQITPGSVRVDITHGHGDRLRLRIDAEAQHPVRAVKILVRGLSPVALLDLLDQETPMTPTVRRYPNDLRIPLVAAYTADGETIGACCGDPQARAKRFAVCPEYMGALAGTST